MGKCKHPNTTRLQIMAILQTPQKDNQNSNSLLQKSLCAATQVAYGQLLAVGAAFLTFKNITE